LKLTGGKNAPLLYKLHLSSLVDHELKWKKWPTGKTGIQVTKDNPQQIGAPEFSQNW